MAKKKRAVIGLRGIAFAPVIKNDILAYESGPAKAYPWVGGLTMSPKESTQDIFYDDSLYASFRDLKGYDVELRFGEISIEDLEALRLGKLNATTNTFEADFVPEASTFALRFETNTVDKVPYYWNYRVFDLTGVRFGDFATKGDSVTVNEVIINGVAKAPMMRSVKPLAMMELNDEGDNLTECEAFMAGGEKFPVTP